MEGEGKRMSEGSSAALFVMVVFLVSYFVTGAIRRWFERRSTGFAEEYMSRFVFPIVDKARDHGITQAELNEMWAEALKLSDAYRPPGGIFRELVEHRIADAACPDCDGDGGWHCLDDIDDDDWVECGRCEGTGRA
jgi:hypothetical protein